jgi:F0F1-type ATP synthase membrane subunit b/b'
MHRIVHNSFFLRSIAGLAIVAWLFASSAIAQQEPHSHDGEAAHSHAEGDHALGEAAHGAETGHAEAGHGDDHAYPGWKSDLPFWGIIAFIGFIFAIKKMGWGSFTSGLAGREAEELRLINEAEGLQRQAAEQLKAHRGQMEALDEEVRGVLAEGQRDADHTRRDIRAVADREAANARARADLEISRVKDQTLSELFENFSQRVIDATQQKLHGNLNPAQQDKLIDEALSEFAVGQKQRV